MYLADENIERGILRQGDIISKVHLLGAINLNGIQYSSLPAKPEERLSWTVPSPPKISDVMVLSHSCEIATENSVKVTSIILGPLRDINTATDPARVRELIESNEIDQANPAASFLKYFYVSPNPNLEYKDGAVVDFSKCFSVRKQSYNMLVAQKLTQLTPEVANSMALKLALYFHRSQNSAAA